METLEDLSEFIKKIENQKKANDEILIEIEEKDKQQAKQENDREELEIGIEIFVADHFDQDLRLLIEENFDEVADKINSSYFEINKLKADIEKYLQRKESLIGSAFVSVWNPRFKRKSYKRFEKFLSEQPDIVSKFAVTQTCDLNIANLYKVINILSRIPEFVNFLKNLKYKSEKINKIQIQKNDLLRKLEFDNFLWIKDGIVNFSEILNCPFPPSKSCSHLDFVNHWLENANNLRNLIEYIIAYKELRSKIDSCKIKIEKLVPRAKLQYYKNFFNEVHTYLRESRIHSEYFSEQSSDKFEFEDYREFLKDSWSLIQKLKELSKLYKECKNWRNRIETEKSAEEIHLAISETQKNLVEKSIAAFNQFLYEKINSRKANFEQNIIAYHDNWKDDILDNLFQRIKEVMGIFVTTNLSTRYNIPNRPGLFDFVIIDEASQNDIASVLPLLFRAKHAIIIGDPNQLRHISHLKDRMVEKFAEESQLGSSLIDYHYTKVSAYDLSGKVFQEFVDKSPFVLKNHYRCHHDIIQFSNREFYNSKLFPKTCIDKDISPVKPGITWKKIPGEYSDHENPEEAKAIIHFIDELFRNGLKKNVSIGIITPFRNQKKLLLSLLIQKRMITGKPNDQILASTVHSFQGDERDIIIYSPVLSKGINKRTQEWLDKSTELLNVAITRARCALLVFGDGDYCMQTSGLHKKLLNYCLSAEESSDLPNFESRSEKIFYDSLKSAGFDFQYQVPIGKYRVDFILKKDDGFVCIELDGSQHCQARSYDYTRDQFLKELGYDVVRIPNNIVENDVDAIVPLLKKIIV